MTSSKGHVISGCRTESERKRRFPWRLADRDRDVSRGSGRSCRQACQPCSGPVGTQLRHTPGKTEWDFVPSLTPSLIRQILMEHLAPARSGVSPCLSPNYSPRMSQEHLPFTTMDYSSLHSQEGVTLSSSPLGVSTSVQSERGPGLRDRRVPFFRRPAAHTVAML